MTTLWLRWLHDTVWLYGQTQTFQASLDIKTNSMLRVFLEKLIASKMFINSPFFLEPKIHCSLHKRRLLHTILSPFDTVLIAISYKVPSKVHFNIILSSLCECPSWYSVLKSSVCFLTFICLCIMNIFRSYNQQNATFLDFLFLRMFYMFQAVPPPTIRSKKTVHTASAASGSNGW